MEGLDFYIPAAVGGAAFLFRLPALVRRRHDPLLRSVGGLLLVASAVFVFAAPPTIAWVNRVTGVPNISAPLVYCLLTGFCASCLVLIINWRGGDAASRRRATRWCTGVYAAVIVALAVLFALADAPEERLRDLDTYYATTPFMREMIVLYLVAHTAAVLVTTVLCCRWSRQIHGWLRSGILLLTAGYLLNLGYDGAKFAAVAARWAGRDWDWLSTGLAPRLASLSAVLIGIGFVLPLAGQRASQRRRARVAYRRLGPLWREVRHAVPGSTPVRMSRWSPPQLLLTQRTSAIHDGMLLLAPYFDTAVRDRAHAAALRHGARAEEAAAIADAALTVAALRARSRAPDEAARAGPVPARESPFDLVRMSEALSHPVVADVRRRASRQESAP
ncbi:MAB_1171c family putative transporter [Streptomyces sp. JJ36]|uniref:MAB_1171c family putative transporter n=1 Tax=Streptomyces sp. JJ36 TaxID=2736645 RepID=UPI001F174994|nr:MAB_1171c family putative transporter [Streptomyces sp. JJ36]MCF6522407.1 hypothetical protein [Streptomyces sp. JJ36]